MSPIFPDGAYSKHTNGGLMQSFLKGFDVGHQQTHASSGRHGWAQGAQTVAEHHPATGATLRRAAAGAKRFDGTCQALGAQAVDSMRGVGHGRQA